MIRISNYTVSRILPFALLASPLMGQDPASNEEDEIIELSPFVVDSSRDTGYYATNTLAGTRLNSSMKDVASPISILTKELMNDVGATNVQDVLVYSVNVQNENEYAPDDTEGESISSTVQTRVRGLSGGTPTRGYFKTLFRADGYNTDRITVARGPNSILFGLGNPAGVIDSTPYMANLGKFHGSIRLRTDNWGSVRSTLDFNVPVGDDMLALRVAAMKQDAKTFIEPETDDETRYYGALTFQPFKRTTIRASYEDMKNDRNRARRQLPYDRISDWIAIGSPLYDHTSGLWTQDGGSTWVAPSVIEAQYPGSNIAFWGEALGQGTTIDGTSRVHIAGGAVGDENLYQGKFWRSMGLSFDPTSNYDKTFSDESLIDIGTNYYGEGSMTELRGDITTLSLEQRVFDNLSVEMSFNLENFDRSQDEMIRQGLGGIKADVNYYLPYDIDRNTGYPVDPATGLVPVDGTGAPVDLFETAPSLATRPAAKPALNPNRGRAMVDSQYLGWTQNVQIKTERILATYTLDFDRFDLGYLGRHVFGAMYQDERTDEFKFKRRLVNQGEFFVGRNGNAPDFTDVNNDNNIRTRFYLNLPGLPDDNGVAYPGSMIMPPWDSQIGAFGTDGVPRITRNEIVSKLLVMQSFLFDDKLVLTYGLRDDSQDFDTSGVNTRDPETGEWLYEGSALSGNPVSDSGTTSTYGIVYHTPIDGVSLTYNRADTFSPNVGNVKWNGDALPANTGEGEDFGINLELLDGKLNVRMNYFSNSSVDSLELDWYYEEPKWSTIMYMDAPWGPIQTYNNRVNNGAITYGDGYGPEDVNTITPWLIPGGMDAIRATRDYESEGFELELFYRPTPKLDIRFTLANIEATNTRVNPYYIEYVDSRIEVWEKYFALPAGRQWWGSFPDPLDDWETNPASDGYGLINNAAALPRIEEFRASAGQTNTRAREWRSNLIVNYRWGDWSKGLSTGGALRYRSAAAIGYYGKPNPYNSPIEVTDVTRPIDGDEIFEVDAWISYRKPMELFGSDVTWVVALNVQNLLDDDDLIANRAHTDGEVIHWSMKSPRTFIFSSSLEF